MNSCALKLDPASSVWGIASSIDIYNCNPIKIRDANQIKQFVVECKTYDPEKVKVFAQDFFKGTHSTINVTLRH